MKVHVADIPLTNQLVGQVKLGVQVGLTSAVGLIGKVSTLSAISTRQAAQHVADKALGQPLREAISKITPFTGNSTLMESGSVANLYSAFSASSGYGATQF